MGVPPTFVEGGVGYRFITGTNNPFQVSTRIFAHRIGTTRLETAFQPIWPNCLNPKKHINEITFLSQNMLFYPKRFFSGFSQQWLCPGPCPWALAHFVRFFFCELHKIVNFSVFVHLFSHSFFFLQFFYGIPTKFHQNRVEKR